MERIEHFFLILIVLSSSGPLVITENVVKNLDEGLNKPAIKEALDLIGIGDCLDCIMELYKTSANQKANVDQTS